MNALFGGQASSVSAAAAQVEPERSAAGSSASPKPGEDINALVRGAAKDLSDYQRLRAEGNLGEAGQKLEQLKRSSTS
jgi:hypothetical protein